MKKEENYGILASIDWNSNKWQDNPTPEDLRQSKFGNVIKTGKTAMMSFLLSIHQLKNY